MELSDKTMALYDDMATKENEFVATIESLPLPRKEVRKLLKMFVDAKCTREEFHNSLRAKH